MMRNMNKLQFCLAAVIIVFSVGVGAECNPQMASNIDDSRYQILSADTVKDTSTGLIWQRCPLGYAWSTTMETCASIAGEPSQFKWAEALSAAAAIGDGWRLPNSKELETLVKRDCYRPAIDTAVFSSLELGFVWSSTPASAYFGNAWAIQFLNGGIVSVDKNSGDGYKVRLVKAPENQ